MLVQVELFQVIIAERSPNQTIVLRERNGSRCFPIMIGFNEAVAIDRRIKEIAVPRPQTHDLLQQVIVAMGGTLERVILNDLREKCFYALLCVRQNDRLLEIDSRPSDAIALAVRMNVPIFAEEEVIRQAMVVE